METRFSRKGTLIAL
ncbi:hypothetical protein RDABS01_019279 [Bienertia sinuspersici]